MFSLIIPTYNRAEFIINTVQSVLTQTCEDFEIIIVDDGSTDNTEEIIKNISDKRVLYYKKENGERAAARNLGIKLAKGKYITFLDSDDQLLPNHFEEAENLIQKYNKPEWFHLGYVIKDGSGRVINKIDHLNGNLNQKLIKGNFLSCNGVFIRNDIARKNLFNEDRSLSALEDWELWLRLATKYKLHYSNKVTSIIFNHEQRSVLKTNIKKLIDRVNIFMHYILNNNDIKNYYKGKLHLFKSSCYSYVALHIALTKQNKILAVKYFIKAITSNPAFIFSRRFLAIIKHLIF